MTWISKGEAKHVCKTPIVHPWSYHYPEEGFSADDSHVYSGAVWQCDDCDLEWTLTDKGEWERSDHEPLP